MYFPDYVKLLNNLRKKKYAGWKICGNFVLGGYCVRTKAVNKYDITF